MADAPNPSPTTVADPVAGQGLDHLAHLHRMSRTAGLGSSDYTAVNIAAVLAVLIGAASALALVAPVFLFIPVVGVVIAALAIVQIRRSGGTQTGLGLAILGLVLSFGLTAYTGLQTYRSYAQDSQDSAAMDALLRDFGQKIDKRDYDDAYKLLDPRLQDQVTRSSFEGTFEAIANSPNTGRVIGFRSNNRFGIDADPTTPTTRIGFGYAIVDTEKLNGDHGFRLECRFRTTGGDWKIFDIPQFFATKAAGNAGGGGSGAASGQVGPPSPK